MSVIRNINRNKNAFLRNIKKALLISFLKTRRFRPLFDPAAVRNVLLLRLDDKIGDMVVTTFTAQRLAQQGYQVSVLTGPLCSTMLEKCRYLDKVFLYKNRMSLKELHAQRFDVVIDFDDVQDLERLKLAWDLKAGYNIGFNKSGLNIYNLPIDFLNDEQHITERHKQVLRLFNIEPECAKYHLGECEIEHQKVVQTLEYVAEDMVVAINPFSGAQDKDFSAAQVIELISFIHDINPSSKVVMIGPTKKVESFSTHGAYVVADSTINTAIETVRIADLIISTDTSIVHIANALNRQLVAIYNKRKLKDTGLPGYKIWAPNYIGATQIVIDEANVCDYSLSQAFPIIGNLLKKAQ
ncbi:glycosyltransferase family 9 protein [Rouxiella sp. T17]|uniref:glycosyltransferase family 9 protein n=1 Tax=Rouxiella sp. T17 TaxID=3085684 RepID=UPI002FC85E13